MAIITKNYLEFMLKILVLAQRHFLLAEASKNNISHISRMENNGYKKCKKKTVGAELKKCQTNGFKRSREDSNLRPTA